MTAVTCSYWEGCSNLATHAYGGDDFCDEHDIRTSEEATIDRLRAAVADLKAKLETYEIAGGPREEEQRNYGADRAAEALFKVATHPGRYPGVFGGESMRACADAIEAIKVERDTLRDDARACAFSLAEDIAATEISRLSELLSTAVKFLRLRRLYGDAAEIESELAVPEEEK